MPPVDGCAHRRERHDVQHRESAAPEAADRADRAGSEGADRVPSSIDWVAERWLDAEVRLDPVLGTRLGRGHGDDRLGDYSPEGVAACTDAARGALAELRAVRPRDRVDEVTARDLGERLALRLARSEARLEFCDLTVLETPAQLIRQAFDLMPAETPQDWSVMARRLDAVPAALAGYRETLARGAAESLAPARRQVLAVAEQAERFASGFFPGLADRGRRTGRLPAELGERLRASAGRAGAAYGDLAGFLRDRIAPGSPEADGVGRDRYALATREFLGVEIDPDESYEWGLEELGRVVREQQRVAREIVPGGSVAEAVAVLDGDPARRVRGEAALREWLQEESDRAIDALAGAVFDIPAPLRRLECRIAPTREGGIYYTAPSDDLSRPGRMWWTVPRGVTEFRTWRELTTVYHEGVPGHHLQMGGAVVNRRELNAWRRGRAGTSGHFEGWALYAEGLMDELGFLDDPAARLGRLDAQRMRAARVVLDIGLHLGKRLPGGSGRWDADSALAFMGRNVTMSSAALRFEVLRYLGWPGQAVSYSLGERVWLRLRRETQAREGAAFDLRGFHDRALRLGSLGLGTFEWAMRPQTPRGS
jgi:uncharacterized protein (DUF885 family)